MRKLKFCARNDDDAISTASTQVLRKPAKVKRRFSSGGSISLMSGPKRSERYVFRVDSGDYVMSFQGERSR